MIFDEIWNKIFSLIKKSIDSICCNVYHFDLQPKFAYHTVSPSDAVSYNNSNSNNQVSFLDSSRASSSYVENHTSSSSSSSAVTTVGAGKESVLNIFHMASVTPQKTNLVRMIQIDRDPRSQNAPNDEVDLHLIPIRNLHDESEKRYNQTMNTSLSSSV